MIPLSNWLSAGERGAFPAEQIASASPCSCSDADQLLRAAEIEEALLRGRREGAEMAGSAWEQQLAAMQAAHASAIASLQAEADEKLSASVAASIAEAVAELRLNIEKATTGALLPVIEENVARKAAAELLHLIDEDLQQQSAPPLEIRAPANLHDALRERLAAKSLSCVLSEAEDIRMICAHGTLRYETLAQRWITALEGNTA